MTPLPESTLVLCFACTLLTPCAAGGLALTNAGLGRSRNASHSLLSTLTVFATATLVYFAAGFAWLGYAGRPEHDLTIAGNVWNWSGAERFLMRGVEFDGSALSLAAVLGMLSAGLVSIIPLGAAAERWRLGSACASTALLSGLTFPLFAHWSWAGGWACRW